MPDVYQCHACDESFGREGYALHVLDRHREPYPGLKLKVDENEEYTGRRWRKTGKYIVRCWCGRTFGHLGFADHLVEHGGVEGHLLEMALGITEVVKP